MITLELGTSLNLLTVITPITASDGRLIWTSSNPLVASVDDNGKIYALSAGSTVIVVTTEDGSNLSDSCLVTVEGSIVANQLIIDKSNTILDLATSRTLTYTISPNSVTNLTLKWTSSDASIVTVDGNGKIYALKIGKVVISAFTTDGSNLSDSLPIEVPSSTLVNQLIIDKSNTILNLDTSRTLTYTIFPDNAADKTLKWTSNDDSIISVDNSGCIYALKTGKTIISAVTTDGSDLSDSVLIGVLGPAIATTLIIDKSHPTLDLDQFVTLTYTILPSSITDLTLKWTSSDPAIVTVDGNGKVYALKPGKVVISASTTDGSNLSDSAPIEVFPETGGNLVKTVTIDKTCLNMKVGDINIISSTVLPVTAADTGLTWTTCSPGVVTVDDTGKVTAIGPGKATVTAKTKDGSEIITTSIITVLNIVITSITSLIETIILEVATSKILEYTIIPANATNKALTWTSSNPYVVTVDSNGKIYAVTPGTVTIAATTIDGTSIGISWIVIVSQLQPVNIFNITDEIKIIEIETSATLQYTIVPASAINKTLKWVSSDPLIAEVNGMGKVYAVKVGTAVISASTTDGSNLSDSCIIMVQDHTPQENPELINKIFYIFGPYDLIGVRDVVGTTLVKIIILGMGLQYIQIEYSLDGIFFIKYPPDGIFSDIRYITIKITILPVPTKETFSITNMELNVTYLVKQIDYEVDEVILGANVYDIKQPKVNEITLTANDYYEATPPVIGDIDLTFDKNTYHSPELNNVNIEVYGSLASSPIIKSIEIETQTYQWASPVIEEVVLTNTLKDAELTSPQLLNLTLSGFVSENSKEVEYERTITSLLKGDTEKHQLTNKTTSQLMDEYLVLNPDIDYAELTPITNSYMSTVINPSFAIITTNPSGDDYVWGQSNQEYTSIVMNNQIIYGIENNEVQITPIPQQGAPVIITGKDINGNEIGMEQVIFFADNQPTLTNKEIIYGNNEKEYLLSYLNIDLDSLVVRIDLLRSGVWTTLDSTRYLIKDNLIHFNSNIEDEVPVEISYKINNSFMVDYNYDTVKDYARITLHNPAAILETLETKYETNKDTSYYNAVEVDLNPLHNNLNSGFIYLTDAIDLATQIDVKMNPDQLNCNGLDRSVILIYLRDKYNNPVVNKELQINCNKGTLLYDNCITNQNGLVVVTYNSPKLTAATTDIITIKQAGLIKSLTVSLTKETSDSRLALQGSINGLNPVIINSLQLVEIEAQLIDEKLTYVYDHGLIFTTNYGVLSPVSQLNNITYTNNLTKNTDVAGIAKCYLSLPGNISSNSQVIISVQSLNNANLKASIAFVTKEN